jgi:hypothetical protein
MMIGHIPLLAVARDPNVDGAQRGPPVHGFEVTTAWSRSIEPRVETTTPNARRSET